jgi:HAD superfamily hydrolase (TIGR01490 family)
MRLALFDFDGTLTRRDTLMPFLRHVVGTPAFVGGIGRLLPQLLAYGVGAMPNDVAKEAVLKQFLAGRHIGDLREYGKVFAQRHLPHLVRGAMLERLRVHRERGDVCLLVSASLDVYVEPWAQAQGFDAILSSVLAVEDGVVTGRLFEGNCYGVEKVRRIRSWLNDRRPEQIWAYGDSRGDREMLALADVAHYRGRLLKGGAGVERRA